MASISPARKKPLIRIPYSTRLVLIVAVVIAALYYGWNYFGSMWILSRHFSDIPPGRVSLIGIKNAGYKIIVANRVAQLVEAKNDKLGEDSGGSDSEGATEGAIKKRIPISEMLGALQGKTDDLSKFVSKLNDLAPDESWPTVRVVWQAEDIQKALAGDPELKKKLVHDLNVDLDGTPLPYLSVSALENGIIVDTPVHVKVQVGPTKQTLIAHVQRPFLPNIMRATQKEYSEKASVTREMMLGYYLQHAKGDKKQDVRKTLESLSSEKSLKDEVERAESVLSTATVVVNDSLIDKASYHVSPVGTQKFYTMVVHVTEEGRQRLWQYSKLHPGDQILLVSDGVAIAAPRIRHDLWTSDFDISQMPDEILVQDAVNSVNEAHKQK